MKRKADEKIRLMPAVKKKKKQHPQIEINSILVDRIVNNIRSRCSQSQTGSIMAKKNVQGKFKTKTSNEVS